ncbi:nucleotidyltransferase family protein, partial [Myxococcota bacterium]|nr:nucleotidyltransferase family protein [Myxococcota bacterium]
MTAPWPRPHQCVISDPHFFPYLSETGVAKDQYKRSLVAWKYRLLSHLEACYSLFDTLSEAKIPHVVVKGLAFATDVYPTLFSRPFSDIDLFVESPSFAECLNLLLDLGYVSTTPPIRTPIHVTLNKAGSPTVELHYATTRDFSDDPSIIRALIASGEPVPFGDSTLWRPAPEHHAAFAILHARNHSFLHPPLWALDLLLLERSYPGTLKRAEILCNSWGLTASFQIATGLVDLFFPGELGADPAREDL